MTQPLRLSRRRFLELTAAAAAATVPVWACRTKEGALVHGDVDADEFAEYAARAPADTPLVKAPWINVTAAGALRMRFETPAVDGGIGVRLTPTFADGRAVDVVTRPTTRTTNWAFPGAILDVAYADRAGTFTLHEAVFEGLQPGGTYRWELIGLDGGPTGTVKAPPGAGEGFRLAWVADTMHPRFARNVERIAPEAPDLVIHGGDIQYTSNPLDTWNGMFAAANALTSRAPIHFCVGNHEEDVPGEYTSTFVPLLGGQGAVLDGEAHWFRWGPIAFVLLDSEHRFESETPQLAALKALLPQLEADATIKRIVVGFHKPYYTFSRHDPRMDMRAALHPLFKGSKVGLVLTGHCHSYERFEVDGLTYVVDGGGGALLYDVNENTEAIGAARPAEIALRKVGSTTFGSTLIDFSAEGGISGRRIALDGKITDTFSIA